MSGGTSHALARRRLDPEFMRRYFVGHGVDFGCGSDPLGEQARFFPRMLSCAPFDLELGHGDASVADHFATASLDFIHSSHLLEHVHDPRVALLHWLTLLQPGGFLVSIVPDEDMYEQGVWPSRYNTDHKWTFTISKPASWSPVSVPLGRLLPTLPAIVHRINRITQDYESSLPGQPDQTPQGRECCIEFVLQKPGGAPL